LKNSAKRRRGRPQSQGRKKRGRRMEAIRIHKVWEAEVDGRGGGKEEQRRTERRQRVQVADSSLGSWFPWIAGAALVGVLAFSYWKWK
jgi:hypothetical protein